MHARGAMVAVLLSLAPHANAATALDACAARVAARPDALDGYRCYWFAARNGAPWDDATGRLEALLASDPRNDHARLVLGAMAADRGEERAGPLLRAAAAGHAARANVDGEVYARVTLAVFLRKRGRLDEAGHELDAALATVRATGRADLEPGVLVQSGWQKYQSRDYAAAVTILREAERRVFPNGSIFDRLETADGLAATSWALGRQVEALDWYDRELELLAGRDPFRTAFVMRNRALIVRELVEAGDREPEELVTAARGALEQATASGNRPAEIGARLLLAATLAPDEAAREARLALDRARTSGSLADRCWAMSATAGTALALDPTGAVGSFALFEEAIALARGAGDPEVLADVLVARSRASWSVRSREQALADGDAALDAIESVRGRQAGGDVRSRVFARFAPFFREHASAILESVGASPPQADVERAFAAIERMRARELLETLAAAGIAPRATVPRATLAALGAALAPDQALLEFVLPRAARPGWVIVVTAREARAHRIHAPAALEREALVYLSLLARRDGSELRGASRLHAGLLANALAALPSEVRRLVVVPDGALHGVPLETLRPSPHGAPLALRFEVTLAASATTWLRWQSVPAPAGDVAVLSFADPATGAAGALPGAAREARRLVSRCGGVLRSGAGATERALKREDLARYRVVHLAAHALTDDTNPERSAVLLAPGDGGEDGRLQYREIAGLPLRGQAVLLPACRSAAGPVIGGEGALGLASAFLEAGAGAVVATRWPVRDDESSWVVALVTDRLAEGCSLASALASARRELIRRDVPAVTWAALAVYGNGDVAPLKVKPRMLASPWRPRADAAGGQRTHLTGHTLENKGLPVASGSHWDPACSLHTRPISDRRPRPASSFRASVRAPRVPRTPIPKARTNSPATARSHASHRQA